MRKVKGLHGEYIIYEIGDMVRITGVGPKWNGMQARVNRINGEYHYIQPVRFDHEIEVYRCEIKPWT